MSVGMCGLLLSGCVSYGNANLADQTVLAQIKVGETNKEQVLALLGEPDSKREASLAGSTFERWSYRRSASMINIWEYIPVPFYGLFFHGLGTPDLQHDLDVFYGSTGLVTTRFYTETIYETGGLFTPMTLVTNTNVDSLPGQSGKPVHWEDKVVGDKPAY
ncbi:MAG: hypothetical protein ACKOCD_09255 [Nitrospiraceae bacterium]